MEMGDFMEPGVSTLNQVEHRGASCLGFWSFLLCQKKGLPRWGG